MRRMPNSEPIEVLLVEDNPGDARLAVEAFKENGGIKLRANLHVVGDGVEAMRYLRRESGYYDKPRPDIILLDLNLPRKDGREVLAEVKEDSELKIIPVLILTTSRAERDIFETYNLRANGYVSKPIDLDEFTDVVTSIKDFWFMTAKLPQEHG